MSPIATLQKPADLQSIDHQPTDRPKLEPMRPEIISEEPIDESVDDSETLIWTDETFMSLPDDGHRYELVDGELIDMGNSGAKHGYIAVILSSALFPIVLKQKLGALFDSSTAFKFKSGNKRAPDVSFVSKERLKDLKELPDGYLDGSPDLVIEVVSPSNTFGEFHTKIVEYFENGTRLVWVVNPNEHYIMVYRSAHEPDRLLKSTDFLDGEDVVPGFSLSIADVFQSPIA